MTIIAIAGTGTDVGKTFVTAALARALRGRGFSVVARKPVLSYAPGDAGSNLHTLVLKPTGPAARLPWYAA